MAVHQRDGEVTSVNNFTVERQRLPLKNRMAYKIADEFLADPYDRKYYADQCKCWPPPFFIPLITLVEVSDFFRLVGSAKGLGSPNIRKNFKCPKTSEFCSIFGSAGWIFYPIGDWSCGDLNSLVISVVLGS